MAASERATARVPRGRAGRAQGGFTLIEVLISLFIVLVGLLGLAGMQAQAHVAELESYQRAQALVLLADMVDRINANRRSAGCFAFTTGTGTPYVGTTTGGGYLGASNCASGFENSQSKDMVDDSVDQWSAQLQGAGETKGGVSVGAMIGARGCVSFDSSTGIYTVVVSWQGMNDTFAPVVNCGNNLYGAEAKRRAVWTTLQIATLS